MKVSSYRGPFNGALLVTTWGQVDSTSPDGFLIGDGLGCIVQVMSDKQVQVGVFVSVTGVVGFCVHGGDTVPSRCLETRSSADVVEW